MTIRLVWVFWIEFNLQLDLADRLPCPYNTAVNRIKYIHALIIAVLVYGQFVSNIHAVGHLNIHDEKGVHHSAQGNFGAHAHHLDGDGHAHDNSDDATTSDCSAFHVLLNLNGVFWAIQNTFKIPHGPEARPNFATRTILNLAPNHQPIRAPPINS